MKFSFLLLVGILIAFGICGCDRDAKRSAAIMTHGGNPDKGRSEIEYFGCASCHTIPGVAGANGLIGPPLEQVADRAYIAGVVKNSPDNLVHWIQHAPSFNPKTAMPDLEIPDKAARDIASYLYTLK
jgi:cytochrome c2